jgi:hypothetical protein
MKFFPLIFSIVIISGCRNAPSELIPVEDMHADLHLLWSAIREVHPGYGFYTTADSLQKIYEKTDASIRSPLSESRFMDLLYPFLCQLRCGHTQLKHSATYKPPTAKQPHLPFHVLVRHHRVWITTHETAQMNTGDEIISINGVPASAIIDHGYDLYCGDGYNETFKELFLGEYDGFEDACNKYYHWAGPYRIELHTTAGRIDHITADPAKNSDFAGGASQKEVNNLRFLKDSSIAVLKIPPFAYTDTAAYKEAFRSIKEKGIKYLILDMRHNTGGDIRVATRLLSYLADSPFNIVKDVRARLPNLPLNHFATYFDTSITNNFNLGFKSGYRQNEWYHIDVTSEFGRLYGPLPLAKEAHFDGPLIVLIDGATFSSGALFTAALKAQRKNVRFVGRETAGSEEGCNGMTIQELTLPNTKIVVDFPWMRVVSVAKDPVAGRGIMPDYYVEYTPEDLVSDNDLDLKKAFTLITSF